MTTSPSSAVDSPVTTFAGAADPSNSPSLSPAFLAPREYLNEVISVVHTKGGAGKSSLTTNLAFALSAVGFRVLVIDLDRQTGQSVGLGVPDVHELYGAPADIGAVLRGDVLLSQAIVRDVYPGLDLLPANERSLTEAENMLAEQGIDGQVKLYEVLHESPDRWDVTLIDTPGRQTAIVGVALAASTGVLIPAIPEGGPVAELATVLQHVANAHEVFGTFEVYGVIRMRIGGNSKYRQLAEEQTKLITARFGAPLFRTKVPEDARFGESHLAREPVGAYLPMARSAIAYRYIAEELIISRGWARPQYPSQPGVVTSTFDAPLVFNEEYVGPDRRHDTPDIAYTGPDRRHPDDGTPDLGPSPAQTPIIDPARAEEAYVPRHAKRAEPVTGPVQTPQLTHG